ncbi:MAG: CDP-alcohol phosphatidyltransferase [Bacteroidota bacterium]|nr:CDP-alcohol phosphatidyltransferase [Bacteroidota bacterium]
MSIMNTKSKQVFETISKDRTRTNVLRKYEQQALVYLVQRIPASINSNCLTLIGFCGTLITVSGFILAAYVNRYFLLVGILGFAVNWFGDSLDGRLAYYRNQPRKWYGFSLDLTTDWITTILIGSGFFIYAEGLWKILGCLFVVMYGWEMITALLRYKVTDKYTIDNGLLGPTEVRVVISAILLAEVIFKGTIVYCALFACVVLLIANIVDTRKLLSLANDRDVTEKKKKLEEEQHA